MGDLLLKYKKIKIHLKSIQEKQDYQQKNHCKYDFTLLRISKQKYLFPSDSGAKLLIERDNKETLCQISGPALCSDTVFLCVPSIVFSVLNMSLCSSAVLAQFRLRFISLSAIAE